MKWRMANSRVPEEIWPGNADSWFSRKRSTLGAALVFTAPGIPMIFQGQEFLEDGYFQDTVPLDWARLQAFSGIHLLYRDLIRLRRNWFNQTRGLRGQHINVHHVNNTDKVIAFHRWENGGPGDDVVVVANFANRSYDSYTPRHAAGRPVARAFQQRLAGIQRGFWQPLGLRHHGRWRPAWTTCHFKPTWVSGRIPSLSCRRTIRDGHPAVAPFGTQYERAPRSCHFPIAWRFTASCNITLSSPLGRWLLQSSAAFV